jgi:hypothetical protein
MDQGQKGTTVSSSPYWAELRHAEGCEREQEEHNASAGLQADASLCGERVKCVREMCRGVLPDERQRTLFGGSVEIGIVLICICVGVSAVVLALEAGADAETFFAEA